MASRAISLSLILLCSTPTFTQAFEYPSWHSWKRSWKRSSGTTRNIPPEGYYNPLLTGGSVLTFVPNTFPEGQGEPLNAIISGNSDERVLQQTETDGGLLNYFTSFGFSGECLGQHSGSDQGANLGDGNGILNETAVIRWNYGDPQLGTCKETIQGGNHFRYWVQNGHSANSGAIFMGVSYEMPLQQDHDIVPNGYNNGRDWLVGNITNSVIPSATLTNSTAYNATTSFAGYTYQTRIQYVSGLLQNTSIGINHNITVEINGVTNASDGLVAVLEVSITGTPTKSLAWRPSPPGSWKLYPIFLLFLLTFFSLS